MSPYTHKYRPVHCKDMIGQANAIETLSKYIENYKKEKKKAAFVYGPTGCGKTSIAHALAREKNLELFELNASDFRNKDEINSKLGASIKQQSLFFVGKLILVDEIDGLSGTGDRGGIQEILRLMEESSYPIILTAINPYEQKLSSVRSKSVMVEFEAIGAKDMAPFLLKICEKENLNATEDAIRSIARRSGGDLRAALNDLEILSSAKEITKEMLEELGMREKEENIINALIKIMKSTDPKIAIGAFEYVNEDVDEQLLWIDENLPKEYESPEDLARAYRNLSKADIFQARIRRWQHWRFLVYINALISAGVAVSKDKKYDKFVEYKPTGRILKLWWAKQKSLKKKAIAEKIAIETHTSAKEVVKSMPFFQMMFKKNKKLGDAISEELKLDKEEVEWMEK